MRLRQKLLQRRHSDRSTDSAPLESIQIKKLVFRHRTAVHKRGRGY